MSRTRRTHYESFCAPKSSACGAILRSFSWNLAMTREPTEVTCLVCMWHLGLYMPLVKLREHQYVQSGPALPFAHWCRIRDGLAATRRPPCAPHRNW